MQFVNELFRRNRVLAMFGSFNFIAAAICVVLIITTNIRVNNINAFIKPFKFYISIGIFCWTMSWIMFYLQAPLVVKRYNIMAMIVFTYETVVITWQAANGRLSHFNISTPLYGILFQLMGVAIVILTLWTGYIGYLFFKRKEWELPMKYVWGIRLGILFFVLFALEGGIMGSMLRHTVGGDDGADGLPLVNWSRKHGDLRIAHFMGLHTLQVLPVFAYYFARGHRAVFVFTFIYVAIVAAVLVQALAGLPLF
ncbi:MAG: hypothetical protein EOO04_00115 [Chitinophagaceae bacterium]|nr:MAG: hypothetical protein EOO04_00115 [Chitinophagaceae bacterium]